LSRVLIGLYCSHFFPLAMTFTLSAHGGASCPHAAWLSCIRVRVSCADATPATHRDISARPRGCYFIDDVSRCCTHTL
jgi:hypothetical protein